MDIIEFRAGLKAIKDESGSRADVYAHIDIDSPGLTASIYPFGIGRDAAVRVEASDFDECIAKLQIEWTKVREETDRRHTRLLAVAIIELTADQGECTEPALRGRGFSQVDIDRLGAKAAEEATRLSTLGPFTILKTGGRNAPLEFIAAE